MKSQKITFLILKWIIDPIDYKFIFNISILYLIVWRSILLPLEFFYHPSLKI